MSTALTSSLTVIRFWTKQVVVSFWHCLRSGLQTAQVPDAETLSDYDGVGVQGAAAIEIARTLIMGRPARVARYYIMEHSL